MVILKILAIIGKVLLFLLVFASTAYSVFALWRMFDGGHILVPRSKTNPVRKLDFWPFNAYQLEDTWEVLRIWQFREVRKEAKDVFGKLPDPRRNLKRFIVDLPYAKRELLTLFKNLWRWVWPFAAGLLVALVNLVSPWLAPVNLAIMLAVTALMILWWFRYGSNLRELLMFSVTMTILVLVILTPAGTIAGMCKGFWASVFRLLPILVWIGGIGACAINLLYAFAEHYKYSVLKRLSYISSVALSIFLVVLLVCNIH